MDVSAYAVEKLAASRLADLRAERSRLALLEDAREGRPGVASALGVALVRLGRWLAPAGSTGGGRAGGASAALR